MSLTKNETWIETIDGVPTYHFRSNEFSVATRPATQEEIDAYETAQVDAVAAAGDEKDTRNLQLEQLVIAKNNEITQLEEDNELLTTSNEELTAKVAELEVALENKNAAGSQPDDAKNTSNA